MASGIYEIRNVINGHIYIGSAVNVTKRWNLHICELKKERHHSGHLQNAWNKYGSDAFEFSIKELCPKEDLIVREQHFIDTLFPEYNVCKVAGSHLGMKRSEETREKISAALKGIIRSVQTRTKLSVAGKGVKKPLRSIEHRRKLNAANTGKKRSADTCAKIGASKKGKTHSAESRQKISESRKAWWASKKVNTR